MTKKQHSQELQSNDQQMTKKQHGQEPQSKDQAMTKKQHGQQPQSKDQTNSKGFQQQQQKKIRKRWRTLQNRKYIQFINDPNTRVKLQALQKNQKQKIFNQMSVQIGSRCPRQCKSHHQKMIKKYETIERTVKELGDELVYMEISEEIEARRVMAQEEKKLKNMCVEEAE